MKIRILTIAAVLCLLSLEASAQSDSAWVELSPEGESFRISMPAKATNYEYAVGPIKGKRYQSFAEGSWYTVWSLQSSNVRSEQESDEYLDAGADLVWHTLLQPARDSLTDIARKAARMTYVKEVSGKVLPGREYSFVVGDARGAAQIYLAYQRVFVLVVLDSPTSPWHRMRFFDSLTVTPELAKLQPAPAEPSKANRTDDNEQIFAGREVTKKARVLSKPEPTYTESARQYAVQGTVVLRAVFSKDGEVIKLHVISSLPHGLTRRSIEAARAVKFVPAELDGRPVSMWMEFQYNFNLF